MIRKKLWRVWILALCLCAGCGGKPEGQAARADAEETGPDSRMKHTDGSKEDAAEEAGEEDGLEMAVNERETPDGELQGITIQIYHADDMAEHICVNTALTEEVTPEILLMNLASYGMLPESVQVEQFSVEKAGGKGEEQEAVRLILDLSSDFADHLSSMGTSGELLVMGSLVNTFLDAYDASLIKVTAGGETLETGHQIYDGWLELYDYVQASYSVAEGLLQEGASTFSYPQLQDCADTAIQEKWNSIIEKKVRDLAESLEEGDSLWGSYDVKTINDELLSLVVSGEISAPSAAYPFRFQYTYNIDMKTGENIRLAHYRNVDQIAEDMMNGENYRVIGALASEFQERLAVLYGDAGQLALSLRGFDFGKGQAEQPAGYSWQEDGKTWLSIEVPHALGDYVNVELE